MHSNASILEWYYNFIQMLESLKFQTAASLMFTRNFDQFWECAQPDNYSAATAIHSFPVIYSYKFYNLGSFVDFDSNQRHETNYWAMCTANESAPVLKTKKCIKICIKSVENPQNFCWLHPCTHISFKKFISSQPSISFQKLTTDQITNSPLRYHVWWTKQSKFYLMSIVFSQQYRADMYAMQATLNSVLISFM